MANSEDGKEKRNEGPRSAGAFLELDPDGPAAVQWHAMPTIARMDACLAAILGGRSMDPESFRLDRGQDVVFVVLANRIDPEKRDVIIRACEEIENVRTKGRAILGARWADVERACVCTAPRAAKILEALR